MKRPVKQHAVLNRYTGGLDRRHTLMRPPSRYARMYSNQDVRPEKEDNPGTSDEEVSDSPLDVRNKRIKELEDAIRETKDSWKVALAETDNLSKKMKQDVTKGREMGTEKLAKGMFSVGDILDLCIQNKPDMESEQYQENLHLKGAFDGLIAAKTQLSSVLSSVAGINEVSPQPGDNFDPMLHNACFEIDSETIEPGQIGVVIKSGFVKKDSLIRPADVGIVRYPQRGQTKNNSTEERSEPESDSSDDDLLKQQQSKS